MYLHCMYFSRMNFSLPHPLLALCAIAFLPIGASATPASDKFPVVDLGKLAEAGLEVRFTAPRKLSLYVSRKAGRVLDVLPAQQVLTVLAMDRYGLKVRGQGKNGPLTGWIGQKQAFNPAQLKTVRAFYDRQLEIERHTTAKRPAIGMSLLELKRILGEPTTHEVGVGTGLVARTETLTWIIKQKVDLNELIAAGSDEDLLRMEVEVGRVEISMSNGMATRINQKLGGGVAEVPTVVPPIARPFGLVAAR